MFAFDQAQLPKIQSRKAFIGVDFQADFTDETGALAATEPEGYVGRAAELAGAFRSSGHAVIWTKTQPGPALAHGDEQIMASDFVPPVSTRARRRALEVDALLAGPPDPEAYLNHDEPMCLKPGTPGVELSTEIKQAIPTSDLVIVKSNYSAFKNTQLLRVLRSKMVMEVFICGSLSNIGVYATAIDAAGHGMAITIVDDCCGYRSETRRTLAFSRLSDLTGCEMESAETVQKGLSPSPGKKPVQSPKSNGRDQGEPAEPVTAKEAKETKETTDLSEDLSRLRLEADTSESTSPKPLAKPGPPEMKSLPVLEADQKASKPSVTDADASKTRVDASNRAPMAKDAPVIETDPAAHKETPEKPGPIESDAVPTRSGATDEATASTERPQMGLCAGDTEVIDGTLPPEIEKDAFERLEKEVRWQRMSHQGGEVPRLVAVQGEVAEDGSMPVYRHPSDESPPLLPFSPTVLAIKDATEKHLGHPLNHVLIQFYRDGTDYISEHSDKTIDVVRGSFIANVSLGAQRTMVFRTKRQPKETSSAASIPDDKVTESNTSADKKLTEESRERESSLQTNQSQLKKTASGETAELENGAKLDQPKVIGEGKRQVQRATLRHNSLCKMGLQTNMEWLHSIRQDKRADRDKSEAELAFGGRRISLTFRRIGTFLSRDESEIWGQGATGKTIDEAHAVINGESTEMVEMLKAFGKENHSSLFDWHAHYGKGFDVLHMSNAPRFFASRDRLVNMRIALMLAEYGIGYAKGSMTASKTCNLDDDQLEAASVKFVDSDPAKSTVQGDMAIMMYLHSCYGPSARNKSGEQTSKPDLASQYTRFQKALTFLTRWRRIQKAPSRAENKPDLKTLKEELANWESLSPAPDDGAFMDGKDAPGLVDFALWPVLHDILHVCGEHALDAYPELKKYVEKIAEREAAKAVVPIAKDAQKSER